MFSMQCSSQAIHIGVLKTLMHRCLHCTIGTERVLKYWSPSAFIQTTTRCFNKNNTLVEYMIPSIDAFLNINPQFSHVNQIIGVVQEIWGTGALININVLVP